MTRSDGRARRLRPPGQTDRPARLPSISVIVPVYQEGDQIAGNLSVIRESILKTGLPFELIAVDDGSTDETWHSLHNAKEQVPELAAFRLSRNFGKEAAICAGLAHSRGDACILLDADLQHPPELIPTMVDLWRTGGWDIVEGVKVNRDRTVSPYRLAAGSFYEALRRLSGYDLAGTSDYKLLDRKVVTAWQKMGETNVFFRGMVSWLGFRRTQISFEVRPRSGGRTRWSLWTLVRLAVTAITAFSSLPLQLITALGGFFLAGSVLFGAYALALQLLGLALPGFTTVILLLLVVGGVLMISLGILGTYIGRIFEEVKHRPRYILMDTIPAPSPRFPGPWRRSRPEQSRRFRRRQMSER